MSYSVFDQFEISTIIPLRFLIDMSITNSTIFMLISVLIFYYLFSINVKSIIPGRWQSVIEIIYENIYSVVKDNLGKEGGKFLPFIYTLFIFIAMMNIVGVVPYTFATTAHAVVTMGLSFTIVLGVTILGILNHRSHYLSMFLPAGSPLLLGPILVLIEVVSHCAKAISLGVRLCSNITAGHLLFSILSSFAWEMLTSGSVIIFFTSFIALFIVLFITLLEMVVAFIQAYVFSILTTIYISESEHLH